MRILVVEDEARMLELLRMGLYERGFSAMTACDAETGMEILSAHQFDAVVLDIGLPKLDGYGFTKAVRARGQMTPVLMLTARDSLDDIIQGLDLGADDYLTKPFSFDELAARLHSIARHHRHEGDSIIEVGDVRVDPMRHAVTRNMQSIDVTRLEYRLLVCLLRQAGKCVPRKTLIENVWGSTRNVESGTVDVLVNSLRSKIDVPFGERVIRTVRGAGYLFEQATPGKARC